MRFLRALLPALLVLAVVPVPTAPSEAAVAIGISVNLAPPVLPVYEQPPIPGPGYIWTPGYWAWGPEGYYWVPGTWVYPPVVGVLWTPPWWGWDNGVYIFHSGYWGPHIGFYGGINYGFGYFGAGYEGGYWDHDHFFYNRTVNNFGGVHVTNVYEKTVVNNADTAGTNRVSFNGGNGGTTLQPTTQEQAALHDHHWQPTGAQLQHLNAARSNPALFAKTNNGQPPVTATSQAGHFNNTGAVTGGTTSRFQSNVHATSTGNPGATGVTGSKGGGNPGFHNNFRTTNTGPTGVSGTKGGNPGNRNFRALNTGPAGVKGGGNPTPHVMNQTVHPQQFHPQAPKGQPNGKNQNQHG